MSREHESNHTMCKSVSCYTISPWKHSELFPEKNVQYFDREVMSNDPTPQALLGLECISDEHRGPWTKYRTLSSSLITCDGSTRTPIRPVKVKCSTQTPSANL